MNKTRQLGEFRSCLNCVLSRSRSHTNFFLISIPNSISETANNFIKWVWKYSTSNKLECYAAKAIKNSNGRKRERETEKIETIWRRALIFCSSCLPQIDWYEGDILVFRSIWKFLCYLWVRVGVDLISMAAATTTGGRLPLYQDLFWASFYTYACDKLSAALKLLEHYQQSGTSTAFVWCFWKNIAHDFVVLWHHHIVLFQSFSRSFSFTFVSSP